MLRLISFILDRSNCIRTILGLSLQRCSVIIRKGLLFDPNFVLIFLLLIQRVNRSLPLEKLLRPSPNQGFSLFFSLLLLLLLFILIFHFYLLFGLSFSLLL